MAKTYSPNFPEIFNIVRIENSDDLQEHVRKINHNFLEFYKLADSNIINFITNQISNMFKDDFFNINRESAFYFSESVVVPGYAVTNPNIFENDMILDITSCVYKAVKNSEGILVYELVMNFAHLVPQLDEEVANNNTDIKYALAHNGTAMSWTNIANLLVGCYILTEVYGDIDGVNKSFEIVNSNYMKNSERIYVNGQRVFAGVDYTINTQTRIFTFISYTPVVTDIIRAEIVVK